jgi:RNA polymerase sigma factor (sigma-70 family)
MIEDFVKFRDRAKKSRSKKVKAEYQRLLALCADRLDYLIESRTRKYRGFSNYDDLRQDGRVALMLALNSFDPEKGNFFWWANQYIKTKISREANRHSTFKIPIKHTKEMQPYKVSQMPLIVDKGPDALTSAEDSEVKNRVTSALNRLPNDQRRVVQMYYEMDGFRPHSIGRICEEMNISRINCIKLLTEAKEFLKEDLSSVERA